MEWENQEDEELFDINLELVDNIPPPNYYWERYFLSTGNALLANCLLPVTDLSDAIPVISELHHDVLSVSVLSSPANSMTKMRMAGKTGDFPSSKKLQSKEMTCVSTTNLNMQS